jgi:hypothetical protein
VRIQLVRYKNDEDGEDESTVTCKDTEDFPLGTATWPEYSCHPEAIGMSIVVAPTAFPFHQKPIFQFPEERESPGHKNIS